jgi:hypothetical protein
MFIDKIESECGDIVYYWEVCWHSKGKVLQCSLSPLEETGLPYWKGTTSLSFWRCKLDM